jgi:hypothetical protein
VALAALAALQTLALVDATQQVLQAAITASLIAQAATKISAHTSQQPAGTSPVQ